VWVVSVSMRHCVILAPTVTLSGNTAGHKAGSLGSTRLLDASRLAQTPSKIIHDPSARSVMGAQPPSLGTFLGSGSRRKSLRQQLDAASVKAESGRTTLAEEHIANKNRKGRRSWIQAHGFFLTEVSPEWQTLQTYWACSKCDERGKSALFVATNTTSPIEHLRRYVASIRA
jgi:hypothetical protein